MQPHSQNPKEPLHEPVEQVLSYFNLSSQTPQDVPDGIQCEILELMTLKPLTISHLDSLAGTGFRGPLSKALAGFCGKHAGNVGGGASQDLKLLEGSALQKLP